MTAPLASRPGGVATGKTRAQVAKTMRAAIELHLQGLRDEPETRELIVRENRKYSRRQLIWFRKEPNLQWIHAAGEGESARDEATRVLAALEMRRDAHYS